MTDAEGDAVSMRAFLLGLNVGSIISAQGSILTAPVTLEHMDVQQGLARLRLASGLIATVRIDVVPERATAGGQDQADFDTRT